MPFVLSVRSSCYNYYCLGSNKIAILGTKDVESPPRGKTLQLQQMIRTAATSYLKEKVVALPALPTESQLKALQDRRRFKSILLHLSLLVICEKPNFIILTVPLM
jgi:hypothetical protein